MNIRLQRFALIAEIISALAIVISLIFVGTQVKQSAVQTELNTKTIQLTMAGAYLENINSVEQLLVAHPELVSSIDKLQNGETISSTEKIQLSVYLRSIFRVLQSAFYQHEYFSLDQRFMNQVGETISGLMFLNAFKEHWKESYNSYDPEFQE